MVSVLLAKSIADLSFGGAFIWYLVKFIISLALAVGAVLAGIRLKKHKKSKTE